MQSLSAKTLRLKLPQVLKRVANGEEFMIVYRSQPVGEIVPLRTAERKSIKSFYDLLKKPFGEVRLGRGVTAAKLIRSGRE